MSARELTVPHGEPTAEWLRAARRARQLSWLSLAWMGAEGAIAITAGVLAGSIALVGFGIDSAIEGLASLVIIWRFTGSRLRSHAAEQRAQKLVAVQFFLLAPYVAAEAIHQLVAGDQFQIQTSSRVYTYTVQNWDLFEPTDVHVMEKRGGQVATLISCYPYQVNSQRIVVFATLDA